MTGQKVTMVVRSQTSSGGEITITADNADHAEIKWDCHWRGYGGDESRIREDARVSVDDLIALGKLLEGLRRP